MKISTECISCVIGSAVEIMEKQLPPEQYESLCQQMLKIASSQSWQETPTDFARKLYGFLRDAAGVDDPFKAAKEQSTELALKLLDEMRSVIARTDDPFANTVKVVIGGNIIDCGINRTMDMKKAILQMQEVFDMPLDIKLIRQFEERFYAAGNIFYMLDNCGEAVFDRLLLELFPGSITLGVRGKFVLNDITRAELAASGLDNYPVFDTDDDTPGVSLERSNAELLEAMRKSDLLIAKGQGNYETLDVYDRPIAHLLRIKCPVVSRALALPQGALALSMRNFR
ncbi:MAG: DUF89 family protein [Lentisphaerae bacterium]|nr:DUF89 family protein [Lentisphaerota bacterium]